MGKKAKKKRLIDRTAIRDERKDYCEFCRYHGMGESEAYGGPHHIVHESRGGPDHRMNLIQLCKRHHIDEIHNLHIPLITEEMLFEVVAARENLPISCIIDIVYSLVVNKGARRD